MKSNATILLAAAASIFGFIGGIFIAASIGFHEKFDVFAIAISSALLAGIAAGVGISRAYPKLGFDKRTIWAFGSISLCIGLILFWKMIT